ncbi:hypothetical protein [Cellulomonas fimi]|uniref:Uncharacterized protein n=1 Tax=Cellulomonas fimi TaxID=1708 RepID=A0A7Y0QJ84_CELFI|nr:hypothetical protein [Cellulomonas fimi]NMR21674.1 hypothetical protein [Cellulomonas fimi]
MKLQLRERRIRRRVVASWSTEAFSRLSPAPLPALLEVATQMSASSGRAAGRSVEADAALASPGRSRRAGH